MTRIISALLLIGWAGAAWSDTLFIAHLDGAQVTHQVDTPAQGTGVIILHEADPPLITTILADYNLTSAISASHIHFAPPGTDGLVEFGLTGGDFENPVVGVWDDCRPPCHRMIPPPVSRDIPNLLNGNLYYVVHTKAHSGGENRGQIYAIDDYNVDEDAQVFIAALTADSSGPYGPGALLVAILSSDQTAALLILSAPGILGDPVSADILDGEQLAFPLMSAGEYLDPLIKTWSDDLPAFVSDLQNGLLTVTLTGALSETEEITVTGPLYPIDWYPIIHP